MALITQEQIEAIDKNIAELTANIGKLTEEIAESTKDLEEVNLAIQETNSEISSIETLIPRFTGDPAKQADLREELESEQTKLEAQTESATATRAVILSKQAELADAEASLKQEEDSPILATYNRQLAARQEYGEIPITDEEWEILLAGDEDAARIESLKSDNEIFIKTVNEELALQSAADEYVKKFVEDFKEAEGSLTPTKGFNDSRSKLLDITIPLASIQLGVDNGLTSIQFATSELNPLQMKMLSDIGYLFTYDFDIVGNMVITCDWSKKPEEAEEEEE